MLEYPGGTASRVTNLFNISTTCLKTPGSFLTFLTEIRFVDELRLCFKDDSFFSKECGIVITTIVWKHDSSVSLGFKTIFPILMMFATQKEGYRTIVYEKYMT